MHPTLEIIPREVDAAELPRTDLQMSVKRIDNVGIVVDELGAAVATSARRAGSSSGSPRSSAEDRATPGDRAWRARVPPFP
jgi:hypothetical protein